MIALLAATALAGSLPLTGGLVPSAHPLPPGQLLVSARLDAVGAQTHNDVDGSLRPGLGLSAAWAPTRGLALRLDLGQGSSWASCPLCRNRGVGLSARVNAIESYWFSGGAWVLGAAVHGSGPLVGDAAAGLALELGAGPIHVDLSAPVLWTGTFEHALASYPEIGLTARYGQHWATRLSVRGLVPRAGLTQRYETDAWWVDAGLTLEPSSPGVFLTLGTDLGPPLQGFGLGALGLTGR